MRRSRGRLFPALVVAALALARGAAADDEEGARVYRDSCSSCHDAKTRPLDALRKTRAQWKEAVERMESLGNDVPTGKKLSLLLDYLEHTHGPTTPAPADKK